MFDSKKLPRLFVAILVCLGMAAVATAANCTWQGGNADWDGTNANWSCSPGSDHDPGLNDVAIFQTSNTVDLAIASQTIAGLTMTGGIDLSLSTNGSYLAVSGLVQLSGAGTNLIISGGDSILQADAVIVNSGADIHLEGGNILTIGSPAAGGIDVNIGGEITGYGLIFLGDQVASPTTVMTLDGVLTAEGPAGPRGSPPLAGTLKIIGNGSNSRLNLDGAGGGGDGIVNVSQNATLDIDVQLNDPFDGTINLGANSKLDMASPWTFAGAGAGQINANTGGGTAATISGAAFTQTGDSSSINVDAGESLEIQSQSFTLNDGVINNSGVMTFASPFTKAAEDEGIINNSGHMIFKSDSQIVNYRFGDGFYNTGPTASLTVNPGVNLLLRNNIFDLDGDGSDTNVTTIGTGGILDLYLVSVYGGEPDESFDGRVNLNGGTLSVITDHYAWELGGVVSIGANSGTSFIQGDEVTLNGQVNIGTDSSLWITARAIYDGATFSGAAGSILQRGGTTVASDTLIAVETYTWARLDGGTTINPGATLKLNVTNMESGTDQFSKSVNVNSGTLDITVADGEWQLGTDNGESGTIYFRQTSITPTLEGASTLRAKQGTIDVDGGATIFVPLILEQTSSNYGTLRFVGDGGLAGLAGHLQLRGGDIHDITDDTSVDTQLHLIGGLTVSGPAASGVFVDTFRWDLSQTTIEPGAYFGVYADNIEATGPQKYDNLIAIDQGTLHVDLGNHARWIMNGYLDLDRGTVGGLNEVTPGGDAIEIGDDAGTYATLNVGAPGTSTINSFVQFNSDAYVYIESGAELVVNGGVYFSPVNGANNGVFTGGAGTWLFLGPVTFAEATTIYMPAAYLALAGGDGSNNAIIAPVTMSLETMGNFNGLMTISAPGRLTVNLTDPNGEWTIGSSATINSNGNSPSDIFLAGSDINHNGTMNVYGDAQIAARLDIGGTGEINIIDADGSLTLSGGSLTDPNTISGGVINGPGQLILAPGTALGGNFTISALINQGLLAPGASPGRITLDVYTQTETGVLEIELGGTEPSDLDQLIVKGAAALNGTLNLSFIDDFVPSGGETFNFLAAAGGITGAFDTVNLPALPAGLSWVFNNNPTSLQLLVAASSPGDFNQDGTVDAADYVVWRKNDGMQVGYNTWRTHFGETIGSGSAISANVTVPEPSTLVMLVLAAAGLCSRRRRAA